MLIAHFGGVTFVLLNKMQPTPQNMTGNNTQLLAFVGGFGAAMTHYINRPKVQLNIRTKELLDFSIHYNEYQ